jgi:hypothetical protein
MSKGWLLGIYQAARDMLKLRYLNNPRHPASFEIDFSGVPMFILLLELVE